jgi:hypothetical protein
MGGAEPFTKGRRKISGEAMLNPLPFSVKKVDSLLVIGIVYHSSMLMKTAEIFANRPEAPAMAMERCSCYTDATPTKAGEEP